MPGDADPSPCSGERERESEIDNRRVVGRAKCLRVVATTPKPGRKKREIESERGGGRVQKLQSVSQL